MLQTLLADRFNFAFHRDTKEVPIYALVLGKGGLKSKEVEFGYSSMSAYAGHMTSQKIPMSKLDDFLSGQLSATVTDMTDLKGFFDFTLDWTPDARPGEAGATIDSV